MDPVSSLVTGHVAGKLMDLLTEQFRHHVVERWTRRRAEEFFAAFCAQASAERTLLNDVELELALEKILADEQTSAVLFDAYRRVVLSRSRELGPRVIGLLTAKLVALSRGATEEEDIMFSAAETLTDDELRAFVRFLTEERSRASTDGSIKHPNGLDIELASERFDSNWRASDPRSTGPIDLAGYYGAAWPRKFAALGILIQDMQEREFDYAEDSERHIDQPGTIREITWRLRVPRAYFGLAELIQRADWVDVATA